MSYYPDPQIWSLYFLFLKENAGNVAHIYSINGDFLKQYGQKIEQVTDMWLKVSKIKERDE